MQLSGAKKSNVVGGGLSFLETLANRLEQRGYSVYAITNPADRYGFVFLAERRLVANYKEDDMSAKTWFLFNRRKLKTEIDRIIKVIPEDAIFITVDPFPPDLFAAFHLRKNRSRSTVVTMHHITPSPLFHPFRRGPVRSLISWSLSMFALISVKLQEISVFIDNFRIAEKSGWKMGELVMEMPLSLRQFNVMEPRDEKFQACYVGRLAKNKGIKDLILAWEIVARKIPSAHLTLIGHGQLKKTYMKLIEGKGLAENIYVSGYLSEEEKNIIISKCSLFPFASYEEGWSLSVMEAIDQGVLPILYDLPAYDYVCSSEVKVPPGNVSEFAERIIYYFEHSEVRKEATMKLQSCISNYSQDFVVDTWINQINSRFYL